MSPPTCVQAKPVAMPTSSLSSDKVSEKTMGPKYLSINFLVITTLLSALSSISRATFRRILLNPLSKFLTEASRV